MILGSDSVDPIANAQAGAVAGHADQIEAVRVRVGARIELEQGLDFFGIGPFHDVQGIEVRRIAQPGEEAHAGDVLAPALANARASSGRNRSLSAST